MAPKEKVINIANILWQILPLKSVNLVSYSLLCQLSIHQTENYWINFETFAEILTVESVLEDIDL
mgnify:CR=1 FL=1